MASQDHIKKWRENYYGEKTQHKVLSVILCLILTVSAMIVGTVSANAKNRRHCLCKAKQWLV